jgi:hypothetical protein
MRNIVFAAIALMAPALAWGQPSDSARASTDTLRLDRRGRVVNIDTYAARFNPRKALLFSAILPGAGQAYNKKYWKVPLVYGLMGGGVYLMGIYEGEHERYRTELFNMLNEPANPQPDPVTGLTPFGNRVVNGRLLSPSNANLEQLRNRVNRFRRDRDFSVLLMGVIYFAQMVDAHVDAHLKEFDLNPQLRARLEPSLEPVGGMGNAKGISLVIKW